MTSFASMVGLIESKTLLPTDGLTVPDLDDNIGCLRGLLENAPGSTKTVQGNARECIRQLGLFVT